jgi:hypothetical protein
MTASTQTVSSLRSFNPNLTVNRTLIDALPAFSYDLLNLILQHLFQPENWGAEWIAENTHGYEIIHPIVVKSLEAFLPPNEILPVGKYYCPVQRPALLIWEYIQKYDVFDPKRQETAVGQGVREKGRQTYVELLGPGYSSVMILPFDIDEEMQRPFKHFWDLNAWNALICWQDYSCRVHRDRFITEGTRVSELFAIYRFPRGMKVPIMEKLAQIPGMVQSHYFCLPLPYGEVTSTDRIILFPRVSFLIGRSKSSLEALMPMGFKFPSVLDAVFCVSDTFIRSRIYILKYNATYTDKKYKDRNIWVVSREGQGLVVDSIEGDGASGIGVALVKEFCW